jgi:hypothetical protein
MAGEWIAYDLGLPDKPEVQELIDLTGEPVEVVTFRLLRLWGWAAMNTTDGRARMTVARLVRTCGADADFWRAVEAVGWLEIDETDASVAIPGWDRRFSQAAKSRLQNADRAAAYEDKRGKSPRLSAGEERRGLEKFLLLRETLRSGTPEPGRRGRRFGLRGTPGRLPAIAASGSRRHRRRRGRLGSRSRGGTTRRVRRWPGCRGAGTSRRR